MAKKGEDASNPLLEMDFGEFITTGDDLIIPETPPVKEEPVEEEEIKEEEIDVNKALAGEEEEEETDGTEPPASTDESDETDEPFTLVLARYQLEQGVLSSLDEDALRGVIEKDGEAAAISYLIQTEIESNAKAVSEKLDDYAQEYSELRKAGFSAEEAGNTVLTLETLDGITEDDLQDEEKEDLRRMVLRENYKSTTNFSESKIDRLVKRAFDINADVEDALEALESLKEVKRNEIQAAKESQKQQQEAAQEAYNQQIQSLSKYIEDLDEIVPGKKLNKQTKTKIFETITKPVKQNEDGYAMTAPWVKRSENPVKFDTILTYLYLAGIFDGKWDQVTKTVNTKLTEKLEKKLGESGSSLLGGKSTVQKTSSDKVREDMIGPMKHLLGN